MIVLRLRNVAKHYPGAGDAVCALSDLSLDLATGGFTVVVGPNGAGKSTLLAILAGRERPSAGVVTATIGGRDHDWTGMSAHSRARHVAVIHQDPAAGTADALTVADNLRLTQLGRRLLTFRTAVTGVGRAAMARRLGDGGLATKLDSLVGELSQGQRQLLALEMAAARAASLLLLDEPTASLDRANALSCMQRVQRLHEALGASVVLVTHDMALAARFGDRLIVMRDGRLCADVGGADKHRLKPEDVFRLCGFDRIGETEALAG